MSSRPPKPYRRFRAHGRAADDPDAALQAVRELREQARDGGRARRQADRAAPAAAPTPSRPPRGVPMAGRRRWWSFRGLDGKRIAARLAAGLFVAVVLWGVVGYAVLWAATRDANDRISSTARAALSDPRGGLLGTPQNTLVIGSDADRGRSGARADTVMIMRTDPERDRINYLSIPRDLRVELDGVGTVKITEAYSHRGVRGVVGALRNEIGIPIHHVMVIDFDGVATMVDAVGGIDVDNPFELRDCSYPGGRSVSFPKGEIHLDGARALQYSRVRSCDSDIERARRQQLVVAGLREKLLSPMALPLAPFRGASMVRALSTDMSTNDLAKFGWLQARLPTGDREVLATTPATLFGLSYQLLDPNRAGPQLRRFTGGSSS